MPRIQPNQKPDAKSQELLAGVKEMLGSTPNFFKTLAHSPAALSALVSGLDAMENSQLSKSLREQISLCVAGVNGSDYCASAHTAFGKMNDVDERELAQNLQTKSSDSKVQAALTFARRIVDTRGNISDTDLQAVRKAGYSEGEIVDIAVMVGINTFTNYFSLIAKPDIDFPQVSTGSAKKAA